MLGGGPVGYHAARWATEQPFRVEQAFSPSQGDRQRLFRRIGQPRELSDHDAGGPHSDKHGLRGNRVRDPRGGREAGFQIHGHQDHTRQPRTRRSHGSRRDGQGDDSGG